MSGVEAWRRIREGERRDAMNAARRARDNGAHLLAGFMLGLIANGQAKAVLRMEQDALGALKTKVEWAQVRNG
jgi:hypothetical protein